MFGHRPMLLGIEHFRGVGRPYSVPMLGVLTTLMLLSVVTGVSLGMVGPALAEVVAATVATPTSATVLDLSGPLVAFLTLVGAVGSTVAFFLVKYLLAKAGATGIVKDDVIRQYLTQGFEYAVHFAVSRLATADWTKVDTKNAAIAQAVGYVLAHFPDALKYFGYDGPKLTQVVEARLAAAYPTLVAEAVHPSAEPGVA